MQPPHIKHSSHISFSHTEISILRTLNFDWRAPSPHTHTLTECNQADQADILASLGEAGSIGLKQAKEVFSWAWTQWLDTTEHAAVSQNLDSD